MNYLHLICVLLLKSGLKGLHQLLIGYFGDSQYVKCL